MFLEDVVPEFVQNPITNESQWSNPLRGDLVKNPTPILAQQDIRDPKRLVELVHKYISEHPKIQLSFLLTQDYPFGVRINNFKAADRILYDALSPFYEIELGVLLNLVDYKEPENDNWLLGQINVTTYQDIMDLNKVLSTSSSKEIQEDVMKSSHKPEGSAVVFIGDSVHFQHKICSPLSTTHYKENFLATVLSIGPKKQTKIDVNNSEPRCL